MTTLYRATPRAAGHLACSGAVPLGSCSPASLIHHRPPHNSRRQNSTGSFVPSASWCRSSRHRCSRSPCRSPPCRSPHHRGNRQNCQRCPCSSCAGSCRRPHCSNTNRDQPSSSRSENECVLTQPCDAVHARVVAARPSMARIEVLNFILELWVESEHRLLSIQRES